MPNLRASCNTSLPLALTQALSQPANFGMKSSDCGNCTEVPGKILITEVSQVAFQEHW